MPSSCGRCLLPAGRSIRPIEGPVVHVRKVKPLGAVPRTEQSGRSSDAIPLQSLVEVYLHRGMPGSQNSAAAMRWSSSARVVANCTDAGYGRRSRFPCS